MGLCSKVAPQRRQGVSRFMLQRFHKMHCGGGLAHRPFTARGTGRPALTSGCAIELDVANERSERDIFLG
jgi:hypothetical protein